MGGGLQSWERREGAKPGPGSWLAAGRHFKGGLASQAAMFAVWAGRQRSSCCGGLQSSNRRALPLAAAPPPAHLRVLAHHGRRLVEVLCPLPQRRARPGLQEAGREGQSWA